MRLGSRSSWVNARACTSRIRKVLLPLFLCALCVSAVSPRAFAQGCALCYTTAAAAGAAAARSLNLGILVLLVPTLIMFVGVIVLLVRRANAPAYGRRSASL